MSKKISINIDPTTYDEIKGLRLPFNHFVELGLRAFKDNPQLIKRVAALEERVSVLERLVSNHTNELFVLRR